MSKPIEVNTKCDINNFQEGLKFITENARVKYAYLDECGIGGVMVIVVRYTKIFFQNKNHENYLASHGWEYIEQDEDDDPKTREIAFFNDNFKTR